MPALRRGETPPESPDATIALVRRLREALRPHREAGTLEGFRAVAITEPDDFDEHDIDPDLVEHVTQGALPALYLNLTYDIDHQQPDHPAIASLLADTGVEHVLTYP